MFGCIKHPSPNKQLVPIITTLIKNMTALREEALSKFRSESNQKPDLLTYYAMLWVYIYMLWAKWKKGPPWYEAKKGQE